MASTNIRRHSRRSSSLSSSSSSSSSLASMSFAGDNPVTPPTPLRYLIPFSWEQLPGIPKKNHYNKKESSQNLLPLPPSGNSSRKFSGKDTTPMIKKYSPSESFRRDPFFAAFVECSKDNEFEINGVFRKSSKFPARNAGDRFGLVGMYTSCTKSCAVSDSMVYLPRSRANDF